MKEDFLEDMMTEKNETIKDTKRFKNLISELEQKEKNS